MVISFLFRSLMEEPFPKGHGVFFFLFVGELRRGRSHCTGKTSSSKSIGFIDGSCKVTLRLGICQTCGENVKQPEGVHLAPAGGFLFDKMWKKRGLDDFLVKYLVT